MIPNEDAYYDRMFAESHWNKDAPECIECGGEISEAGDCIECGEHFLTEAEQKEEADIARAEQKYQEWRDEHLGRCE